MRLLLDTHTFLWYIAGDERISVRARTFITDPGNDVLLSVASLWEIAIKVSIGKLTLARPFADLIPEEITLNSVEVVSITLDDLNFISQLPFHHRDPFDRLIVAQSVVRAIPIVGRDDRFRDYGINLLW